MAARRKPPTPAPKPKVLATLTEAERAEYALRMSLHNAKRAELAAAAAYLDSFGEELRVRYKLPAAYDLNLASGEVLERG